MPYYGDAGKGDPDLIASAAAARSLKATALRETGVDISRAVQDASGAGWTGDAQVAFVGVVSATLPDVALLAAGLEAQSAALQTYAGEVRAIKDELARLMSQRYAADQDVAGAEADLKMRMHYADEGIEPPAYSAPLSTHRWRVEEARSELAAVDTQLEALVERRATADATCAAALTAPDVRGGLSGVSGSASLSPTQLLELLAGLSPSDLAVLLKTQPALAEQLLAASPDDVAMWWSQLDPASQAVLVGGASLVIGRLGGVPPLARVEANRLNAQRRLTQVEAEIAERREHRMRDGRYVHAGTLDRLEIERQYLQDAVDGKVQLYLYLPDEQSIIEMIGTPGPDTKRVITYVPGTFTSMHGFYDGGVQQTARWLESKEAGTVAFVFKVGPFPGEDADAGSMNLLRIGEANDTQMALDTGRRLHDFQNEIHVAAPVLAPVKQIAIGHSWGLAAITSSETYGTHYDQVHSLAGAGMPPSWTPDPTTDYRHWSYTDALSMAQATGAVWEGRIPLTDPAFDSTVYEREGDFDLYISSGGSGHGVVSPNPPVSIPATTDPIGNHNLIASDKPENQVALRDLRQALIP